MSFSYSFILRLIPKSIKKLPIFVMPSAKRSERTFAAFSLEGMDQEPKGK